MQQLEALPDNTGGVSAVHARQRAGALSFALSMLVMGTVAGAACTVLVAWVSAVLVVPNAWFDQKPRSYAIQPPTQQVAADQSPIMWICRQYRHATGTGMVLDFRASRIGPATHVMDASAAPLWSYARGDAPPDMHSAWDRANPSRTVPQSRIIEDARGWPMPALLSVHRGTPGGKTATESGVEVGGPSAVIDWATVPMTLPSRLIPLGFALDTAVFGSVFALAMWLRPQYWRARRMLANRCVLCGQSLHGLPAARCPECGTPTDPARHPTAALVARFLRFAIRLPVRAWGIGIAAFIACAASALLDTTNFDVARVLGVAALPAIAAACMLTSIASAKRNRTGEQRFFVCAAIVCMVALAIYGALMAGDWASGFGDLRVVPTACVLALLGAAVAAAIGARNHRRADGAWVRFLTLTGLEAVFTQLLALIVLLAYRTYPEIDLLRQVLLLTPGTAMCLALLTAFLWRKRT